MKTTRFFLVLSAMAVLALSSVGCDNWWLIEGRVVAAPCEAQQKTSTIVETVVDRRWLGYPTPADPVATPTPPVPIPGAQVEMLVRLDRGNPFNDPAWVDSMTADEAGRFEDESAGPTDRFGLRVTAPGYQPAEEVFPIKDNPPTPQAFVVTLRPEGC